MSFRSVRYGFAIVAVATSTLVATGSAHADSANGHGQSVTSPATPSIGGGFKRLANVRSKGTKCGKALIASASGRGKMTLRIDETRSAGTVLSRNISVSKSVISAGVGWDVTKSRSITVSGAHDVPNNKYGTLDAYTKYSVKQFDVQTLFLSTWATTQKNKTAAKPIGVCFKYHQN